MLDYITPFVKPGVTTANSTACATNTWSNVQGTHPGAAQLLPARLHARIPKAVCTSVNDVICHGIPGDKVLKNGDVVNIDVTVIKDGYHGDTSRMFYAGKPSIQAKRLARHHLRMHVAGHLARSAPARTWATSAT